MYFSFFLGMTTLSTQVRESMSILLAGDKVLLCGLLQEAGLS